MSNLDDTGKIIVGAILIYAGAQIPGTPLGNFLIAQGAFLIISAAEHGPKGPAMRSREITARNTIAPRRVIYGFQRVGGIYTFVHLTGENREFLNLVITLSGHELTEIGTMYFDGKAVPIDGSGLASAPARPIDITEVNIASNGIKFGSDHFFTENLKVRVTGGDLPAPLVVDRDYYVEVISTTQIKLRDRWNGPDVDLTTTGSGTRTVDPPNDVKDYTGFVHAEHKLGTTGQTDLTALTTAVGDTDLWSTDHRQRGCAYVWVQLRHSVDIFPNGVPNITWDVKGKKVFDPVTDTTIFSTNGAMIAVDYMTDPNIGMGIPLTLIDDPLFVTARNICVEQVTLADGTAENRYNADGVIILDREHGDTLSDILSAMGGQIAYVGGLFQIFAAAYRAPTTSLSEIDYASPIGVKNLISRQRNFNGIKGVYISPENDWKRSDYPSYNRFIDQTFTVTTGTDRVNITAHEYDNDNIVTLSTDGALPGGLSVVIDHFVINKTTNDFQLALTKGGAAIDITSVGSGTHTSRTDPYRNLDNNLRLYKDIGLPFTKSPFMAQRLAKIILERNRQSVVFEVVGRLTAFENAPPDVININSDIHGWTNKPFEMVSGKPEIAETGEIAYKMRFRETASQVFDFFGSEEKTVDLAKNTDLPNPFINDTVPTSLLIESGTAQLFLRLDGTILTRVRVSWDAPTDEYVLNGGSWDIQFKKTADSTYLQGPRVDGLQVEAFLPDLQDGVAYDFRVRSLNALRVKSDFAQVLNHTVIGKTAPPANVTNFFASQSEANVFMTWNPVTDLDLKGYTIKFGLRGTGVSYDSAIFLTETTAGTSHTTAGLPPGDWTLFIKAIDTTGNVSVIAAVANIIVRTFNPEVKGNDDAPDWLGGRLNFVNHYLGIIVPRSQNRASGNNFNVFDTFVENPFPQSVYTTTEFDLGREGTVRVFSLITGSLGPDPAAGEVVTQNVEVRWADDSGVFTSWTLLLSVNKIFARKIQWRLLTDNTKGISFYSSFLGSVDVEPRAEGAVDVIVPSSGTLAITFELPFFVLPRIKVTPIGLIARYAGFTARTEDGFTINLRDFVGSPVGGTVDWEATTFSLNV